MGYHHPSGRTNPEYMSRFRCDGFQDFDDKQPGDAVQLSLSEAAICRTPGARASLRGAFVSPPDAAETVVPTNQRAPLKTAVPYSSLFSIRIGFGGVRGFAIFAVGAVLKLMLEHKALRL